MTDPVAGRVASPPVAWLEVVAAIAVGAILAVLMNLQVTAHLGDRVPVSLDDPLLQAWEVAWGGHALLHGPTGIFDTNAFWPLRETLALSDPLLGYAPLGLLGGGVGAAVIRYNLLHLLAYSTAFVGAYLLARELGTSRPAAVVAGVAFAYAPWRLSQVNHLNILSSGGIPLSLFLLLRGARGRRPLVVLAGFLVAAWQVSLGFVLGLPLLYLLAVVGTIVLARWVRRGRPSIDRRTLIAGAGGSIVLLTISGLLALPYLESGRLYPESRRTRSEVTFFSAPKSSFLAAPEGNVLWGSATRSVREHLPWENEHTLFPGLMISVLAAIGAFRSSLRLWIRIALSLLAAVTAVLCLGFRLASGALGYRLVYELVPGWDRIRVPARLFAFTTLALALLAAAGSDRLMRLVRRPAHPRLAFVAGVTLAAVVLTEGAGRISMVAVPFPPVGLRSLTAPRLHLPMSEPNLYMLWSTDGFPPIVNGHSGIVPAALQRTIELSIQFPDRESVDYFRSLGIRTVIYHPDLGAGTEWADVPDRSVSGLALCRRTVGDLVVFDLQGSC